VIFTPLGRDLQPLYPVHCPICDRFLGALYRDGLSLKMSAMPCSERCMRLARYARGRARWRRLPVDLRQIWLAAGLLDATSKSPLDPLFVP
jgi:hypothetical protein